MFNVYFQKYRWYIGKSAHLERTDIEKHPNTKMYYNT